MDYEYLILNVDLTITYVYGEDESMPLDYDMNVVPYTTMPVSLSKGFTLRHLLGIFKRYPALDSIFFDNFLTVAEMGFRHIQNNDLNYISVGHVSGGTLGFGHKTCLDVSSGVDGDTFLDFTNYALGEVLDLPMIMSSMVGNSDSGFSKITLPSIPLGMFIQAAIDAMSSCLVSDAVDTN